MRNYLLFFYKSDDTLELNSYNENNDYVANKINIYEILNKGGTECIVKNVAIYMKMKTY